MAEPSAFLEQPRCAVVTGGNRGIGLEICRQLADKGVKAVLTARDVKKGLEAFESLKTSHPRSLLLFHQLDVMDASSITSLADFVNSQFGKLDLLVNNAAVIGVEVDGNAVKASLDGQQEGKQVNWEQVTTQNFETAEECLKTNYYGPKSLIDALLPLLRSSDSPRIVNVSSSSGKLKFVSNDWARGVLSSEENLKEESIDVVLNQLLRDAKEGLLEAKSWPSCIAAYTLSKAALNAYTRLLAKTHPSLMVNAICPGFVKTDINFCTGFLTVEEGAESVVWLALMPETGPSGLFFHRKAISPF